MISLLLMVNSKPTKATWRGKEIILKPGSMITSLEDIAYIAKSGIMIEEIAAILDKFVDPLGFIKQKIAIQRLITILNWKQYQNEGLSYEESEQRKKDALKLYDFYIEKIAPDPTHRTKRRALTNILKHSKKYSFKDLAKAVCNYTPKAMNYDSFHRKDPANFFGIQETYFKDFLPGIFDAKKSYTYQESIVQKIPDTLTPGRLEELNT